MLDKSKMGIVEAVDYAVIMVYRMELGTEFTISSLYSGCKKEFGFNKRQLAIVPRVLENCGLVVKTDNSERTYCNGKVAGLAKTYMRCAR